MDGVWTLEPSEEVCAPERVELTWTPERIECLTRLWEEGVTTAEIGRRIGSYGTLIGDKEILVVRFTAPAVARTVFKTRQHDANFATCR